MGRSFAEHGASTGGWDTRVGQEGPGQADPRAATQGAACFLWEQSLHLDAQMWTCGCFQRHVSTGDVPFPVLTYTPQMQIVWNIYRGITQK